MHELTASEAATVLSILSREGVGEESEISPLGIPTSTFYATRRKIYDAGWLTDRYVPDPWAVGARAVDCVLAKPNPADRARLEGAWASSADNVVLWSGLNTLLAIFFRRSGDPPTVRNGTAISITATVGSLPVYFDYSRLWSRFIRVERETGYPRPLGKAGSDADRTSLLALPEMIVMDQDGGGRSPRPHRWHSPAGIPRGQQRLLDRGIVRSRTFLNLEALPPYESRALGEIVFLTGVLREGVTSVDVLGALNNECRVSPLLLADDGTRILIVALGQVGADAPRRTKLPRAAGQVVATLDGAVQDLQMTIEHVGSVQKLVDHRYHQIVAPPPVLET